MVLKLIMLVAVLLFAYKLMGGKFGNLKQSDPKRRLDSDTLNACDGCGTYMTEKESIIHRGKHYCSKECLPD